MRRMSRKRQIGSQPKHSKKNNKRIGLRLEALEQRWMLTGNITILKSASGTTQPAFSFSGTGPGGFDFDSGFMLDNDLNDTTISSSRRHESLPAGSYSLTEAATPGYSLTNIVCIDSDGETTVDTSNRTAFIDLDDGETVICTFFNAQDAALGTPTARCRRLQYAASGFFVVQQWERGQHGDRGHARGHTVLRCFFEH